MILGGSKSESQTNSKRITNDLSTDALQRLEKAQDRIGKLEIEIEWDW